MNFSSPLYISNQPRYDDQINIVFLENKIFRAIKDDYCLESNYTVLTSLAVPINPSKAQEDLIEYASIGIEAGLFSIFIITLLLHIFMKTAMDEILSIYFTF